jgi:PadR family transcriptional regulator PadR
MYSDVAGNTCRVSDFFDNWTVQVRKGLLDLYVLGALVGRDRYGYELVRALSDVPGLGVTEGTLYPLLSRLRLQGLVSTRLVESAEGPARKYYALTGEGRQVLTLMQDYMDRLNAGARSWREQGSDV